MRLFIFFLFLPTLVLSQTDVVKTKISTRFWGRNKFIVMMEESHWSLVGKKFQDLENKNSLLKKELELSVARENGLHLAVSLQKLRIENEVANAKILKNRLDSVQAKLDSVQRFWVERAVDHSFIFMDWRDTTIKVLDLTCYAFSVNVINGSFLMMRRGPNLFYRNYQRENWLSPDKSGHGWAFTISPLSKPKVLDYPHPDRFPLKNKFER